MSAKQELTKYGLESGRRHRFLRAVTAPSGAGGQQVPSDPNSANSNCREFEAFIKSLNDLEFGDDKIETLKSILAAILVLGEVRFRDGGANKAEVENPMVAAKGIICCFIFF